MAINNNNNRNAFQTLIDREEALSRNRQIWGTEHMQNEEAGAGAGGRAYAAGYDTSFATGTVATANINYDALNTAINQTFTIPTHMINSGYNGGGWTYRQLYRQSPKVETQIEKEQREKKEAYAVIRNKKQAVQKLFIKWRQENQCLSQDEINTNFGSYKHQPWSIEARLLKAIGNGEGFKTKTTEYSPSTNKVYLYGHEIARLSATTREVVSVTFPNTLTTKKEIDLFRLRLRQLGQKCKANKGRTELRLAVREKQILTSGLNFNIPIHQRIIAVPTGYAPVMAAPTVRDSVQLALNLPNPEQEDNSPYLEEKIRIKLGDYKDHRLEFVQSYSPDQDMHVFKVNAWPINTAYAYAFTRERFSVQRTVCSRDLTTNVDLTEAIGKDTVRMMRDELDRRYVEDPALTAARNMAATRHWHTEGYNR